MSRSSTSTVILILILALAGCPGTTDDPPTDPDCRDPTELRRCTQDDECACGTNVVSDECAVGVRACIDEARQCPDFCTGLAGDRRLGCVDGVCASRDCPEYAAIACTGGEIVPGVDEQGCPRSQCRCADGTLSASDFCPDPFCQDQARYRRCTFNEECGCGFNARRGQCDFGHPGCLDPDPPCPELCSEPFVCAEGTCSPLVCPQYGEPQCRGGEIIMGQDELGCPRPECQCADGQPPDLGVCGLRCTLPDSYRRCVEHADCRCGTNNLTGECDYGISPCIDPTEQCPDFCTGLAGHLRIACQEGRCTQVPCPLYELPECEGGEIFGSEDELGCPRPECRCPDGQPPDLGVCGLRCTDPDAYRVCTVHADCTCGTNRRTGACDYGVAACIDPERQCPDFCTGIAGHLRIVCQEGQCTQIQCLRDEPPPCEGGQIVLGQDALGCPQPECRCPDGQAPVDGRCGGADPCGDPADYRSCREHADCTCGTNRRTGACDYGVAACIDPERQCPDFCTGIAGHLRIACQEGQCTQLQCLRDEPPPCEGGQIVLGQDALGCPQPECRCPDGQAPVDGRCGGAGVCQDPIVYRRCERDDQCTCGSNTETGACDYGLAQCIDPRRQCPDFCTGIDGQQRVVCLEGSCGLYRCPRFEPPRCEGGQIVLVELDHGCTKPICQCPDGQPPEAGVCNRLVCDDPAQSRRCTGDRDCTCGTNIANGLCDYGRPECIDPRLQCPDFCSGIHGRFVITCVDGTCTQHLAR